MNLLHTNAIIFLFLLVFRAKANQYHRARILHFVGNPVEVGDASFELFNDGLLEISEDGYVVSIGEFPMNLTVPLEKVIDHRPNIIIPGMIDTHVHASQVHLSSSRSGGLLQWLKDDIFPGEARYAAGCNHNLTTNVSEECHQARLAAGQQGMMDFLTQLIISGTTTAACYTTPYKETVQSLFELAEMVNMRILAGKNG